MRAIWDFALLVLLLSVPFWVLEAVATAMPELLPIALPMSALAAVTPLVAGWILLARREGGPAVRTWLARAFDLQRAPMAWWPVAIVAWPAILALAAVVQWLLGTELPPIRADPGTVALMVGLFAVGGITEELGWQGYAWPRMTATMSEPRAALELGLFWSAWHIVPYLQTGHGVGWVVWHCLVTVLLRVLSAWLFVRGGRSVALVALFHLFCNLGYFLYPEYGSHYDPQLTFLVLLPITGVLLLGWHSRAATT